MLQNSSLSKVLSAAVLGLAMVLAACADRGEQIYDTDKNPDGYPQLAVDLVNNIQTGRLIGGPAITEAFGQLYTDHSGLLDNPGWTEIIGKLGVRFADFADSLAANGIADYSLAAEYYQLAAFALPHDSRIRERSAEFDRWYQAAQAPTIDLSPLTGDSEDLPEILAALRPFALYDSQSYRFLQTYLSEPLRKRLEAAGGLRPEVIDSLLPVDCALAAYCGLISTPPTEPVVQFEGPWIDVVAYRVRRIGNDYYSAEAYFIPHSDAPGRLTFGLEMLTVDSTIVPVDLRASVPREQWKAGQLAAAGREFRFDQPVARVSLGLVDATEDPAHLVEVRDRVDALWPLTVEVLPQTDSLR